MGRWSKPTHEPVALAGFEWVARGAHHRPARGETRFGVLAVTSNALMSEDGLVPVAFTSPTMARAMCASVPASWVELPAVRRAA